MFPDRSRGAPRSGAGRQAEGRSFLSPSSHPDRLWTRTQTRFRKSQCQTQAANTGKGRDPLCSPSRATAAPKRDPAAPPCLLSPQAFPAMPDLCDNPSTADTGQASGEPRRRHFFHPARGSEHPRAARPYTPIPHRPARPGHTPRTKPRPPGGAGEVSARGWSPRPGQTPQNPRPGRQHL